MKKRNLGLGLLCLVVVVVCVVGSRFLLGGANAEITINGVTYEMRTVSVQEFMDNGYVLATSSTEGNSVYTYNYEGAQLEAKTYYNMAVPFCPKDGTEAPISCWLYNPTPEPVDIREAKICAISCAVSELREYNIPVSVAGLELNSQSKTDLQAYMDEHMKGYKFSENEDYNAFSYTKGSVSYTFTFGEDDVLVDAIARNNV